MSVVIESLGVRLGKRAILEGIDLELPAAAVTGLVGRNGAGKSTLLKAVVGIIRPSAGAVRFGDEADDHVSIGYLPEYVGFVEHLSGLRNLRLLADLGRSQNDVDPGALLDRVGLDGRDRRPVSTYSQGMRRRLGIAQAIMDGPSVVVLDEPANGLDPDGIRWARELVRDLARHGTCVIVASHLLGELELSCDHLVMLHGGRVVFDGHRSHIEQYVRTLEVQVDDAASRPRLESIAGVDWVDERVGLIQADGPVPDFVAQMVTAGVRLRSVGPTATALEDLYLRLSKDSVA